MSFLTVHLGDVQDHIRIILSLTSWEYLHLCVGCFFSVNSFIVSSILLILHLPEIREPKFPFIKKKQNPKHQSPQFLNKPQSPG